MVVAHHTYTLADRPPFFAQGFLEGAGTVGVTLFFLLSAFLLTTNLLKSENTNGQYFIRRFVRIAPAYYLNIGILFLFFAPPGQSMSAQGFKQIVFNLSFMHYLTPGTSSSLNVIGALWTLTIEFTLYLILPFIVWTLIKFRLLGLGFWFALSWALRWFFAVDSDLRLFYFQKTNLEAHELLYLIRQPPSTLIIFLFGVSLAYAIHFTRFRFIANQKVARVATGLSALTLLGCMSLTNFAYSGQGGALFQLFDVLVALVVAPLLYAAASLTSNRERLVTRIGKWLGDHSYGLYLWHFPIILAVYGRGAFEKPAELSWIALKIVVIVVLTFVAAWLSFRFVERPAMAFAKNRMRSL